MQIFKSVLYLQNSIINFFYDSRRNPSIASHKVADAFRAGFSFLFPCDCERGERRIWRKKFVKHLFKDLDKD